MIAGSTLLAMVLMMALATEGAATSTEGSAARPGAPTPVPPPPPCPAGAPSDLAWQALRAWPTWTTTDPKALGLPLGTGLNLRLSPRSAVHYVYPPQKPGGATSHGGLLAFTITHTGLYRVALDIPAWIDVVQTGNGANARVQTSVAHGHGAPCSGIRKQVDFRLFPGRYWLQIAGAQPDHARLSLAEIR